MSAYVIFLIYLGILSLIAFIAFVADKIKAQNGAWRIPESVLLGLSAIGGAVGGYLAMFIAWHKVRKWYFHVAEILSIILHIAITLLLFFLI